MHLQRASKLICIVIGLVAISGCDATEHTEGRGAFEALAGVAVHLRDDQATLVSTLQQYADQKGLRMVVKDLLPRRGRKVLQVQMYLSEKSHFYGDNFLDVAKFSMHAYSHEGEAVWRPKWQEVIQKLVATFGKERVAETITPGR